LDFVGFIEHGRDTPPQFLLGEPQPVTTIFLGGVTPTHLAPKQLERLLETVLRWLRLNPGHEFSVEPNPATLSKEKVAVLADHGVNRISLWKMRGHVLARHSRPNFLIHCLKQEVQSRHRFGPASRFGSDGGWPVCFSARRSFYSGSSHAFGFAKAWARHDLMVTVNLLQHCRPFRHGR
jgi:hypothetical protein